MKYQGVGVPGDEMEILHGYADGDWMQTTPLRYRLGWRHWLKRHTCWVCWGNGEVWQKCPERWCGTQELVPCPRCGVHHIRLEDGDG